LIDLHHGRHHGRPVVVVKQVTAKPKKVRSSFGGRERFSDRCKNHTAYGAVRCPFKQTGLTLRLR
jgi:hypothetical protein